MNVGEMIESPHFRLFDAMSAIEIMDPKMDSGFNNSADMTLDRAVDAGIVAQKLSYEDLIGIWDQLLMYFMLWLEGHTIVQTYFCCLYLHDVKFVKPMPLFGAFVDAFLLACRIARTTVLQANAFDDEDFLPNTFGFDLDAFVFSAVPSEILERIGKERQKLAKDADRLAKEAAARLEFIGDYVMALVDYQEIAHAGAAASTNGRKKTLEKVHDRLASCLRLLEQFRADARPVPASALHCFDPSAIRHLLVPGPPRTVEPLADPKAAFDLWISHVNELMLCETLIQKHLVKLLGGGIVYKDEPNVLPRSIAQICVSEASFVQRLILESLEWYLFPLEARQHCKKLFDGFLEHSQTLFTHLLKLAHANNARHFRRLAHVFGELNTLQHEAWQLDEELRQVFGANLRHPQPCWMWIMEHALQAMLTKLFLGFALDLYDEAEMHMIYWYADYLYGLRIYNMNELQHAKEQPVGGGSGGKRKPKAQPQKNGQTGQRPRSPTPLLMLLEATQHSVRGLFRLLAFCLRSGCINLPPATIEGMDQRFVLRFRSLEHFRLPHLPSYSDFQASAASAQAPADSRIVLEAAQSSFAEASQLLDKFSNSIGKEPTGALSLAGICADSGKGIKKVIVANQLAITQLDRALKNNQKMKVATSTTYHPHLLTVQVAPFS
jgi:hypothetical protein